jgi:hypothetical protein
MRAVRWSSRTQRALLLKHHDSHHIMVERHATLSNKMML